jgi:hypothetical protein
MNRLRDLVLERHFRDPRAGLFPPPQDDLSLNLMDRARLAQRLERQATESIDPSN